MAKKKSIREQILSKLKHNEEWHYYYDTVAKKNTSCVSVSLSPEELQWIEEYENEHGELPHLGASKVEMYCGNLYLTFDF